MKLISIAVCLISSILIVDAFPQVISPPPVSGLKPSTNSTGFTSSGTALTTTTSSAVSTTTTSSAAKTTTTSAPKSTSPASLSPSGSTKNVTAPNAPKIAGDPVIITKQEAAPLPLPPKSPPAVPKAPAGALGGPLQQDPNLKVGTQESGTQSITGQDIASTSGQTSN